MKTQAVLVLLDEKERKKRKMKLLAVFLVLAGAALAAPMPERGVCAHRGDSFSFPENTVPALESAVLKRAQMVEFDVQRCKTGELVVMHDPTVDRTTDGTGAIVDLTLDQIKALDAGSWKGSRFAGVRVPTFDEAIDCIARDGIWINIHCKNGEGIAAEVARTIRAKGRLHQAFVAAELSDLADARREVPEILACNMTRTGKWNCSWTPAESRAYAEATAKAKCQFLQLIAPCTADDLRVIHEAGGKVSYFFEDSPDRARQRFEQGADFVLTNNLDPMLAAFGGVVRTEDRSEKDATELWNVFGSFGRMTGRAVRTASGGWRLEDKGCRLECTLDVDKGVCLRRTTLTNLSNQPVTATCLMDRFPLDEGEWEVYTQRNFWENESRGAWQPLNTMVGVCNPNMRSCNGVAPMLAMWNRQNARGRVFHLLTESAYQLQAVRFNPGGNKTSIRVETGMDSQQLNYRLAPGESVSLPEVLSFEFKNRSDLDCHRLHAWWNRRYPSRAPTSIYNSWLCRFDKIDLATLLQQVNRAQELGLEYFVIDAGWFGPAEDWWRVRGDWEELPEGRLGGRLADVSAAVRKAGMKFGIWVEAESVDTKSKTREKHPDWVLPGGFYDFTNVRARMALVDTLCGLVKKYKVDFFKFDFNQNLDCDPTGRCFSTYNAGYRAFLREVRRRNPGIYLEGCASGGYLMDLGWARSFDSFWLSDNQSPEVGLRVVKETMLRLPPRYIDRWITARSLTGVQVDYTGADSRLLSTDDATWTQARTFAPSYFDAFTDGGAFCFSCDLNAFSAEHVAHFKTALGVHRQQGDFWRKAIFRILCDEREVTVFQSSDEDLGEIHLLGVAQRPNQGFLRVYPVIDETATYEVGGKRISAAEIAREGVVMPLLHWQANEVVLRRTGIYPK